jgi:predicted  nucleic acid-binding Zn-ribbon protein
MRVKRLIKLEEKQYQENLSRAREAAALGSELRNSYEQKKTLTREDAKKLERLEKLTKKIRGEAGGSDEDALLDNPPHELESALGKLADVAGSLSKVVEKTPRQVISAVVIEQANVVLQLVRITRNLFH